MANENTADKGAAPEEVKNTLVTLKTKEASPRKKEFSLAQANALLTLKNPQWELADDKHKWNGTEIAKK